MKTQLKKENWKDCDILWCNWKSNDSVWPPGAWDYFCCFIWRDLLFWIWMPFVVDYSSSASVSVFVLLLNCWPLSHQWLAVMLTSLQVPFLCGNFFCHSFLPLTFKCFPAHWKSAYWRQSNRLKWPGTFCLFPFEERSPSHKDYVGQLWVQDVLEHGRSTPAILLYPSINGTDASNITSGKYV